MSEPKYPLLDVGDVVTLSVPLGDHFKLQGLPGNGPWRVRSHQRLSGVQRYTYLETMDGVPLPDPYWPYYFEVQPFLTQVDRAAKKHLDSKPGLF